MSSTSENSFGARLSNARKMRDAITTFANYAPPRTSESLAELDLLIAATQTSNNAVATAIDSYNDKVKMRQAEFRTNDISVIKLLSPIKSAVVAMYGKDSRETTAVSNLVARIRESKSIKIVDANGDERTISQSEQSYGSLTQMFKDLVATLTHFGNYAPSRTELKLASLQTFIIGLDSLNTAANISAIQLRNSRNTRNTHYDDLKERAQRVKAYISSEYGIQSKEYSLVKGLTI
jgi:hypothetical protein